MKKIDFIIKNFQAKAFIQDLKNEIGEGWCEDAVLKNFIGYHQSTFQVLKLDYVLFGILILEIIFALLLFQSSGTNNLEYIVDYIFMSVGICALILFLFLIFFTSKYFINNSK